MESVERRALLVALVVAIVVAFDTPRDFTTDTGTGWQVFIFIVGLLALAAAVVMVVIAIAPPAVLEVSQESRERLLFFALASLVTGILTVVILRAYATYYLHRHGAGVF